jgi:hypothetical protein
MEVCFALKHMDHKQLYKKRNLQVTTTIESFIVLMMKAYLEKPMFFQTYIR